MKPVHWLKSELKTKRWLIAGLAGVFLISVSVSYYLYKFNIINSGWASILIVDRIRIIVFFSETGNYFNFRLYIYIYIDGKKWQQ